MASTNAQKTKTQQDLIAKQKAKDAAAAAKANRAAELNAPITEAEKELAEAGQTAEGATPAEGTKVETDEQASEVAKLAAQGLKDGGSLTDEEVQSVAGKALSEMAEDKAEGEKLEATERENAELKGQIEALGARVDELEAALAKVGVTVKKDCTHVGSIDDLGKIDDLKA